MEENSTHLSKDTPKKRKLPLLIIIAVIITCLMITCCICISFYILSIGNVPSNRAEISEPVRATSEQNSFNITPATTAIVVLATPTHTAENTPTVAITCNDYLGVNRVLYGIQQQDASCIATTVGSNGTLFSPTGIEIHPSEASHFTYNHQDVEKILSNGFTGAATVRCIGYKQHDGGQVNILVEGLAIDWKKILDNYPASFPHTMLVLNPNSGTNQNFTLDYIIGEHEENLPYHSLSSCPIISVK